MCDGFGILLVFPINPSHQQGEIMKALIVKWQDTNKYVLHVKSNNDLLLERKKQQHEHLHPKIVSWDEWELIQLCQ